MLTSKFTLLLALVSSVWAVPVRREVPQEHSHEQFLTIVNKFLKVDNPDGIVDAVFALLGNAAAQQGLGKIADPTCLQLATADRAFTNAKAAGDVEGQVGALIYRALERNTGKVGQASDPCESIKAVNPEIAAIQQHQDAASPNAAEINKAITLELAKQIKAVGGNPLDALKAGTFAPGDVNDPTGAGNSCDDLGDPVGCIFTKNLLVPDASEAEILAAVGDDSNVEGTTTSAAQTATATASEATTTAAETTTTASETAAETTTTAAETATATATETTTSAAETTATETTTSAAETTATETTTSAAETTATETTTSAAETTTAATDCPAVSTVTVTAGAEKTVTVTVSATATATKGRNNNKPAQTATRRKQRTRTAQQHTRTAARATRTQTAQQTATATATENKEATVTQTATATQAETATATKEGTATQATATQAKEEAAATQTANSDNKKKNLQKYEGHVGDILAPQVIKGVRGFEVDGLNIPDLTAALEKSCDIQEALCTAAVDSQVGRILGISAEQCAEQNVACRDLAAKAGAQFEFS